MSLSLLMSCCTWSRLHALILDLFISLFYSLYVVSLFVLKCSIVAGFAFMQSMKFLTIFSISDMFWSEYSKMIWLWVDFCGVGICLVSICCHTCTCLDCYHTCSDSFGFFWSYILFGWYPLFLLFSVVSLSVV